MAETRPIKTLYRIYKIQYNGQPTTPSNPALKRNFEKKGMAVITLQRNGNVNATYQIKEVRKVLPKSTGRSAGI